MHREEFSLRTEIESDWARWLVVLEGGCQGIDPEGHQSSGE